MITVYHSVTKDIMSDPRYMLLFNTKFGNLKENSI